MGSLMAGWSTTPQCSKKILKRTTSSLTKGEVNRYWRAKRTQSREHLEEAHRAAAIARSRSFMNIELPEEAEDYFPDMNSEGGSQSGSLPTTPTANERGDENTKDCWWRRSNFAYLNEPPLHESKHNAYVAQFHVVDVRARAAEMESPRGGHLPHTKSSLSIF